MTSLAVLPFAVFVFTAADSSSLVGDAEFLEFLADWTDEDAHWLDQEMNEPESSNEDFLDQPEPEIESPKGDVER